MSHFRRATVLVTLLLGTATLPGCGAVEPITSDVVPTAAVTPPATVTSPSAVSPPAATPSAVTVPVSPVPATTVTVTTSPRAKSSPAHGPRIVYFRIARKPKCAEGTAVSRADPVPLIIEWKISGATGGALSVDDPTNTPGTYGPVDLAGSQEFPFSCSGEVGSTETHTYALYTTGGTGPARSKTVTASATVLDQGLGTN